MILLVIPLFLFSSCSGGKKKKTVRIPAPVVKSKAYTINGITYYPLASSVGYEEEGIASWYGKQFHGRKTANGEKYDMFGRTAAHKTLPFNTILLVTNLENEKKTMVRVNDRGPFVSGRIIDLTLTVAKKLKMDQNGTARVQIVAMTKTDTDEKGNLYIAHPLVDYNKGNFTIQVGSFISRENAVQLNSKLKSEYGFASINKFTWGSDVFYRVRVGRYDNLEKAKQSLRAWNRRGFPGSFVVAEK